MLVIMWHSIRNNGQIVIWKLPDIIKTFYIQDNSTLEIENDLNAISLFMWCVSS